MSHPAHDGIQERSLPSPTLRSSSPTTQVFFTPDDNVLNELLRAGIIWEKDIDNIKHYGLYSQTNLSNTRQATIIVEKILLDAVVAWFIKSSWMSSNSVIVRDTKKKEPSFGPFSWDITAPTYLNGFVKDGEKGKLRQGTLCGHILLNREINLNDLAPSIA